jgi:hypothetical protein
MTHYIQYKERAVAKFLAEQFPDIDWTFDHQIKGGCSRRRPDAFKHFGTHAISVETDESSHKFYDCSCESLKVVQHFQDAGSVNHVIIRFNPDEYHDTSGTKVPSCWGKTPTTMEPRVAPKQVKQWADRLLKLKETVQMFILHPPERSIEIVELFYDR